MPIGIFTLDKTHNIDLNKAILSEITLVNFEGIEAKRFSVILRTRGCSYARSPSGGCMHCALLQNSNPNISDYNLKKQLENELKKYQNQEFQQLDILTLGSFFDDNEVSEEFRTYALKLAFRIKSLKRVLVESRPEFITEEKIEDALHLLKGINLEIGIGIESSNNAVRYNLLNKGYSLSEVEDSVKLLYKLKACFLGYVLVKPLGLNEKEAIEDAVETINFIFDLGKKYKIPTRVALEPFYIPRKSIAEKEYYEGQYKPLRLWSLVEILRRTDNLGSIFIGLNDEGLSDGLVVSNCDLCNATVMKALQQYNGNQDLHSLIKLDCFCKREWLEAYGY